MMEKRGVVAPGVTRDIEDKQKPGEKKAGQQKQIESLDDDFTKRAADNAAEKLKKPGS